MNLSLKLNYHLGTTFVLGGAALVWFLGIGGRDLYLLPLLCWLPFAGWRIWKDKTVFIITWPSQRLINRAFSFRKWALGIFFLLFCLRAFLRAISASNGASGILVSLAMLFLICLKVICGGLTTKYIPGLIILLPPLEFSLHSTGFIHILYGSS